MRGAATRWLQSGGARARAVGFDAAVLTGYGSKVVMIRRTMSKSGDFITVAYSGV